MKDLEKNEKVMKVLQDLGEASYALLHAYQLMGRQGKKVYFLIDKNELKNFEDLMLEYMTSDFYKFDSCLVAVKRIPESRTDLVGREVSDLGVASFLLMKGFKVLGKKNKNIYFDAPDTHEFYTTIRSYLTSAFHQFDSCLMAVKKISSYLD